MQFQSGILLFIGQGVLGVELDNVRTEVYLELRTGPLLGSLLGHECSMEKKSSMILEFCNLIERR